MNPTPAQIKAYIELVKAIADSIRELKSVPAGHLYAMLCATMTADQFNVIIGKLVSGGLITRDQSHMLHWKG